MFDKLKEIVAVVIVSLLLIAAGCLGFGEKEITLWEIPEGYPIVYEFELGLSPNRDKADFNITNTGNVTMEKAKVKFEASREGSFYFSVISFGNIKPGETKQTKVDAKVLPPTKILVWHGDLKSWVVVFPPSVKPTATPKITAAVKGIATTAPTEEWTKTLGGNDDDVANSVQQTSDGGYILAGATVSYKAGMGDVLAGFGSTREALLLSIGAGMSDVWLVKTDAKGNEQWTKTFGGTNDDSISSVQQTSNDGYKLVCMTSLVRRSLSYLFCYSDDGYILGGMTSSQGAGEFDALLIKTDAKGNEQWSKTFGGTKNDDISSVKQTSDGGFIIAGNTQSYGYGAYDAWLIKTDAQGNEQWSKTFGGTKDDIISFVQQTSDGGYMLGGKTSSQGTGEFDALLIKTDAKGNEQWNRTFGGKEDDFINSVEKTPDGGYILAGVANNADAWLIKTDAQGNEQWSKAFGGARSFSQYIKYFINSVQQTSDDGYILGGITLSLGAGKSDALLIKTDAKGDEQWNKAFGGKNDEFAVFGQQTSDGGYVLIGNTRSIGAGGFDAWLIKLGEPTMPTVIPTPTTTPTPTSIPTPAIILKSVIGKTIVITNMEYLQESDIIIELTFEQGYYTFGATKINSLQSKFSKESAKITEMRTLDSLSVNVTKAKGYWQTWRFYDNGKVLMRDYDGANSTGNWILKTPTAN